MNLRATFLRLACLASLLLTTRLATAQQPTTAPTPPRRHRCAAAQHRPGSERPGTHHHAHRAHLPPGSRLGQPRRAPRHAAAASEQRVFGALRQRHPCGAHARRTGPRYGAGAAAGPPCRAAPAAGHAARPRYYHPNGPFWGAFASAVVISPFYGAVPTAIISLKHVETRNLMAPQPQLLEDQAYANGYKQQANRRKAGRTWAGYGAGSAAYLAFIALLVLSFAGSL